MTEQFDSQLDGAELNSAKSSRPPQETWEQQAGDFRISPQGSHPLGSGEVMPTGAHSPEETANAPKVDSGFLPVLKNFNFLTLWSGQVFSQLADKVYLVLMIALISSRFQAEGQSISGWVSAIMIAFTLPAIFFGSVAGILVGRTAKQPVLVLTNILRGALVLSIPFLLGWVGNAPGWGGLPLGFDLLLGVTFLVSTLTQFFAPAEQAILPLVVEKRDLLSANSLYTTTMMAASVVGFAIGERVLDWADHWVQSLLGLASGKPLAVGVSYLLAAGLILLMRVHEPDHMTASETHIWQDIQDGLDFLKKHRQVRGALIRLVVLFSVFAALAVLAVRLAQVIPALETDQFGWLLSVGSLGLGVGAIVVGQFGERQSRAKLGIVGTLGMAACLVVLALFETHLGWAIASITLFGFFAALLGIPAQTTIQEKTPPQMRGKIFGLQNNAVNIALSLPLALAGIAEQFLGLRITFLALAVFIVIGNLSTWYFNFPRRSPS